MILLYANPIEVRYVDYEPKYCIGINAGLLKSFFLYDYVKYSGRPEIILFGMAGGSRNMEVDKLYDWREVVDMESVIVSQACDAYYIPFRSIRYIIDYNREKVMSTGINWAWRRYQHYRMQHKFNRWLHEQSYIQD